MHKKMIYLQDFLKVILRSFLKNGFKKVIFYDPVKFERKMLFLRYFPIFMQKNFLRLSIKTLQLLVRFCSIFLFIQKNLLMQMWTHLKFF